MLRYIVVVNMPFPNISFPSIWRCIYGTVNSVSTYEVAVAGEISVWKAAVFLRSLAFSSLHCTTGGTVALKARSGMQWFPTDEEREAT